MTTIAICVCTFRRDHITETLATLRPLDLPPGVTARIIVVDNDDTPSAQARVAVASEGPGLPVDYLHAPGRNISIARNACLDAAGEAGWIAFIDDDELAPPGWIMALWERAEATGADAVFGPVRSLWPDDAPGWMVELDLHAPPPHRVNGAVETGPSNNVLLRWHGAPWTGERFDLARGRSGGEDTDFFFRLRRMGAVYEIAEDAIADEPVLPGRMSLGWLRQRRFRSGQSHVTSTTGIAGRISLALKASAKSAYSFARVLPALHSPAGWRFWYLRGIFHAGVVAGCLSLPERQSYG